MQVIVQLRCWPGLATSEGGVWQLPQGGCKAGRAIQALLHMTLHSADYRGSM